MPKRFGWRRLEMLYYQMPLFFFLGALLYVFPDLAKALGMIYLVLVLYSYSSHWSR